MAPNGQARMNHDELFPGHVSTLAVTDPELIEIFDNFAFDEVLRHGHLNARTRLMVQLASMIACLALREYRVMLGAALAVGVTPIEIKEIVYQAVPYAGWPRSLTSSTPPTRCSPSAASSCRCPASPRPRPRTVRRGAARSRSRSSGPKWWRSSMPPPLRTRGTSRDSCRPTASATTTPAPGSTCRRVSFSPSACSLRSADATRRSRAMSPRT
jgi:alkylhydroperoxidase/carboxymuconolactone decarboxylase family protein YurZ